MSNIGKIGNFIARCIIAGALSYWLAIGLAFVNFLFFYTDAGPNPWTVWLEEITGGNFFGEEVLVLAVLCTIAVFYAPIFPLFEKTAALWKKRLVTVFGVVVVVGVPLAYIFYTAYQVEQRDAGYAMDRERSSRAFEYLRENKAELRRQYSGCFVLTQEFATYPLDPKYASMSKIDRFNAFSKLDLKGGGAFCVDSLDSY